MSLIIIQDTREKKSHHNEIENYCRQNNIMIVRKKLDVGDYMIGEYRDFNYYPIGNISIDIKGDGGLLELATDLYGDKKSLNKKYRKCYEQGIKLIVLVEEEISSLQELCKWKSKHTKINGRMLLDLIHTLQISYGIEFKFCKKENTGEVLVGLLTDNQAVKPRNTSSQVNSQDNN